MEVLCLATKLFKFKLRYPVFQWRCLQNAFYEPPKHFNPFKKTYLNDVDHGQPKTANRICLTVLGNGAVGQPRCVAMFTEYKNYLFNCGEGVGRLCREYDINPVQLRHIFVTQNAWRNLSGVPDLYLTQQTFGVPKMYLHGPPGVEKFIFLLSSPKKSVSIATRSHCDPPYIDDTMEVEYVPIQYSMNVKESISKVKKNGKIDNLAISYICKIHEKPGEFMVEKCIEHGVPIGPSLLKLKNGGNIRLSSGKLVRSCDVHCEASPGSVFLVVDCPTEDLLDAFVNEVRFHSYQLPEDKSHTVSAVFHFSPPHIFKSAKYQQWISRFHQATYQFILNSDNPTISSESIHQVQHILNLLHPRIFSLLHESNKKAAFVNYNSPSIIQSYSMQQLHLRPMKKLDSSSVVKCNPEKYIEKVKGLPGFDTSIQKLHNLLSKASENLAKDADFPEVLFLGTGSSASTASRNVSAILINTSSTCSVLLDCGEGTFTQLVRFFGPHNVGSVLQKISCIFISHHHIDHYLGLFELIKARKEAFHGSINHYTPIAVILPSNVESIVRTFDEIFEPIKADIRTFSCHSLIAGEKKRYYDLRKFLGTVELYTVPVEHCVESYGVTLNCGSQWKIVYSGDTAPCQNLIDAGENCTLLIHEATLEDDFEQEASTKKHSTPCQVLEVSEKMNAKYAILTHFSKRYLAIPVLQECNYMRIGCAFDFMRIRLGDLAVLPLFIPLLKCIFCEVLEKHSEKTSSVVKFENVFLKALKL